MWPDNETPVGAAGRRGGATASLTALAILDTTAVSRVSGLFSSPSRYWPSRRSCFGRKTRYSENARFHDESLYEWPTGRRMGKQLLCIAGYATGWVVRVSQTEELSTA
jgi:hypothetical protein